MYITYWYDTNWDYKLKVQALSTCNISPRPFVSFTRTLKHQCLPRSAVDGEFLIEEIYFLRIVSCLGVLFFGYNKTYSTVTYVCNLCHHWSFIKMLRLLCVISTTLLDLQIRFTDTSVYSKMFSGSGAMYLFTQNNQNVYEIMTFNEGCRSCSLTTWYYKVHYINLNIHIYMYKTNKKVLSVLKMNPLVQRHKRRQIKLLNFWSTMHFYTFLKPYSIKMHWSKI